MSATLPVPCPIMIMISNTVGVCRAARSARLAHGRIRNFLFINILSLYIDDNLQKLYSTPSHNASRPSPLISYALWNLCNTINVTLCDRVTFDDTSKESDALCAVDCWLSKSHIQPLFNKICVKFSSRQSKQVIANTWVMRKLSKKCRN